MENSAKIRRKALFLALPTGIIYLVLEKKITLSLALSVLLVVAVTGGYSQYFLNANLPGLERWAGAISIISTYSLSYLMNLDDVRSCLPGKSIFRWKLESMLYIAACLSIYLFYTMALFVKLIYQKATLEMASFLGLFLFLSFVIIMTKRLFNIYRSNFSD